MANASKLQLELARAKRQLYQLGLENTRLRQQLDAAEFAIRSQAVSLETALKEKEELEKELKSRKGKKTEVVDDPA